MARTNRSPLSRSPVKFHGMFGTKAKAVAREKRVHGFIKPVRVHGEMRYAVMTRNPSYRKARKRT